MAKAECLPDLFAFCQIQILDWYYDDLLQNPEWRMAERSYVVMYYAFVFVGLLMRGLEFKF
jgi:hypothetical protein